MNFKSDMLEKANSAKELVELARQQGCMHELDDTELERVIGGYAKNPAADDIWGERVGVGTLVWFYHYDASGTEQVNMGKVKAKTTDSATGNVTYTVIEAGYTVPGRTKFPITLVPRNVLMIQ